MAPVCGCIFAEGHYNLFDCAYQGFASGDLERDAWAVRLLALMPREITGQKHGRDLPPVWETESSQSGHMAAWNIVTRLFGVRRLVQYAGSPLIIRSTGP